MSTLVQINEYLDNTRELSVEELNALIRTMDQSAEPQSSQGFAHSILGYMKLAEIKDEIATFADAKAKALRLKERHNWLFVEPAVPEEKAPAIETPKAPKAPKVKTEKKSDIAMRIFTGLADKSKANVIEVFARELNTTLAGAQSYYYAVGGEKSGKRGRKPSADSTPKAAYVRKTPVGPTKREQAAKLFASAPDKSRAAVVSLFMDKLGMTKAGATTYAYTVGVQRLRSAKK